MSHFVASALHSAHRQRCDLVLRAEVVFDSPRLEAEVTFSQFIFFIRRWNDEGGGVAGLIDPAALFM